MIQYFEGDEVCWEWYGILRIIKYFEDYQGIYNNQWSDDILVIQGFWVRASVVQCIWSLWLGIRNGWGYWLILVFGIDVKVIEVTNRINKLGIQSRRDVYYGPSRIWEYPRYQPILSNSSTEKQQNSQFSFPSK